MVNKPLIRPAISGGVTLGGGWLTSHRKNSPKGPANSTSQVSMLRVSNPLGGNHQGLSRKEGHPPDTQAKIDLMSHVVRK